MELVDINANIKRSTSKKETFSKNQKTNDEILKSNAAKGKNKIDFEPQYDGYREKDKSIRLLNNYTGAWNNDKKIVSTFRNS